MRRSLRSTVAASAIAAGTVLGAIGLTAPAAGAMTARETAVSECKAANGTFGTNYVYASDGTRHFLSHYCSYVDYYGQRWTDFADRNYNYEMTCEGGPRSKATARTCYS